jgi:hypothetical protein
VHVCCVCAGAGRVMRRQLQVGSESAAGLDAGWGKQSYTVLRTSSQLFSGDFLLIMDATPFFTTRIAYGTRLCPHPDTGCWWLRFRSSR